MHHPSSQRLNRSARGESQDHDKTTKRDPLTPTRPTKSIYMNPANNNPIAMTEAVATDDQLVAPVSLAAKLAGALVDDRLSAVVVVPCSRRVFSLRCPSADVPLRAVRAVV